MKAKDKASLRNVTMAVYDSATNQSACSRTQRACVCGCFCAFQYVTLQNRFKKIVGAVKETAVVLQPQYVSESYIHD